MTPDDIVDPLRPLQHLSEALRDTILLRPGAQRDIAPDIAQLLGTWRWAKGVDPAAPNRSPDTATPEALRADQLQMTNARVTP